MARGAMIQSLDVMAIVGPTASGKTALSIELAKVVDGEIINGDALQVYRGLDIGTAKITEQEMQGIPHHLFDIKEPDEAFSVADYQSAVRQAIEEVRARQKMPIIVGGTGLYIQAVLFDFRFTEQAADRKVRKQLEQQLADKGSAYLYNKLLELDPQSAASIHPNNHRRLVRALEIMEVTGKTKQQHEQQAGHVPYYNHVIVGLDIERDILYERINNRVDRMLEQGLLQEVEQLWNAGIRNVQSVQAIGYKELYAYLDGKCSFAEAVGAIKKNSRHYAKRQFTYFRNKLQILWINALNPVSQQVEQILQEIKDFESDKSNGTTMH